VTKTTWSEVPRKEKDRIAELYQRRADLTPEAEALGVNVTSLARNVRFFIEYRKMFLTEAAEIINIPESTSRKYLDHQELEGDNWIFWGDTEAPDYSYVMLRLIRLVAIAYDIRKYVNAGDLIAFDQQAFSTWRSVWQVGGTQTLREVLGGVNDIIGDFDTWFDEGYLIGSNHDKRLNKATNGELDIGMLLHSKKLRYSNYDWLRINTSKRGSIRVVHPTPFSNNPIQLGRAFYDSSPIKEDFIVAHCHLEEWGWTKDGLHQVNALGTCRDPLRTQYKMISVNKHFQWNSGFLVLKDGYYERMSLNATNWRKVLGDELYKLSPLYEMEMS